MSVPAWPATLPQRFQRDGYTETDPDNLVSSDNSIGPAKVRRRSTSAVRPISGTMLMTEDQYDTFRSFRTNDVMSGALAFTFPDPHFGDDLLVRFHQPPSYTQVGITWQVNIALEVLP